MQTPLSLTNLISDAWQALPLLWESQWYRNGHIYRSITPKLTARIKYDSSSPWMFIFKEDFRTWVGKGVWGCIQRVFYIVQSIKMVPLPEKVIAYCFQTPWRPLQERNIANQ